MTIDCYIENNETVPYLKPYIKTMSSCSKQEKKKKKPLLKEDIGEDYYNFDWGMIPETSHKTHKLQRKEKINSSKLKFKNSVHRKADTNDWH